MMKQTFIALLLLSLASASVLAQGPSEPEAGQRQGRKHEAAYHHELGFVLDGLKPSGLRLKFGNEKKAFRLFVQDVAVTTGTQKLDGLMDVENSLKRFVVGLGLERRYALAQRLQFCFGGNVEYSYSREGFEYVLPSEIQKKHLTEQNELYSFEKNKGWGLSLVCGMNYFVTKRLVLGAEYTPRFAFGTSKVETKGEVEEIVDTKREKISFSSFQLGGESALNFSLAFRF